MKFDPAWKAVLLRAAWQQGEGMYLITSSNPWALRFAFVRPARTNVTSRSRDDLLERLRLCETEWKSVPQLLVLRRSQGCLNTNLGIRDKRQIQNETKTIYCISLIIFCEESWGEEERATTTTEPLRLYEFYLLCLFRYWIFFFGSPIQFLAFALLTASTETCENESFSLTLPTCWKIKCSTGWWITTTLITAIAFRMCGNFNWAESPSLIDDLCVWSSQQCSMKRTLNWPIKINFERSMKREETISSGRQHLINGLSQSINNPSINGSLTVVG